MDTAEYIVLQIDGDYAHLRRKDDETAEPILVARALLPEEIREGSILLREFLMYTLVER
ncbi:MAG: chorismate--pyruvate lyase [Clostridiales bacterium]|nr:chorismate--pyruvate lyase [Clostridiales bacterium]